MNVTEHYCHRCGVWRALDRWSFWCRACTERASFGFNPREAT